MDNKVSKDGIPSVETVQETKWHQMFIEDRSNSKNPENHVKLTKMNNKWNQRPQDTNIGRRISKIIIITLENEIETH